MYPNWCFAVTPTTIDFIDEKPTNPEVQILSKKPCKKMSSAEKISIETKLLT